MEQYRFAVDSCPRSTRPGLQPTMKNQSIPRAILPFGKVLVDPEEAPKTLPPYFNKQPVHNTFYRPWWNEALTGSMRHNSATQFIHELGTTRCKEKVTKHSHSHNKYSLLKILAILSSYYSYSKRES
jgi:hypothetical protein